MEHRNRSAFPPANPAPAVAHLAQRGHSGQRTGAGYSGLQSGARRHVRRRPARRDRSSPTEFLTGARRGQRLSSQSDGRLLPGSLPARVGPQAASRGAMQAFPSSAAAHLSPSRLAPVQPLSETKKSMHASPPTTRVRQSAPSSSDGRPLPDREAVQSRWLAALAYDHNQAVLQLEFRGGTVYPYFHVPRQAYPNLCQT